MHYIAENPNLLQLLEKYQSEKTDIIEAFIKDESVLLSLTQNPSIISIITLSIADFIASTNNHTSIQSNIKKILNICKNYREDAKKDIELFNDREKQLIATIEQLSNWCKDPNSI